MKFRDVVLLLVGSGLVVFGMLIGDLLENDAFADGHSIQAVNTESSPPPPIDISQLAESVKYEYALVDASKNSASHKFVHQTSSNPKTVELVSHEDMDVFPYNYVHIMNKF